MAKDGFGGKVNPDELPQDALWAALRALVTDRDREVAKLRRDLECALSSHGRQQTNTLAFQRELHQVLAVLKDLLYYAEQNRCEHEELQRGGAIWTICTQCDRTWSDSEGGFQPDPIPAQIAAARQILRVLSPKA